MSRSDWPSIVSPDDQSVTFVELFFDLVFVFSVTQVVGVLYHHLDWLGVAQVVLIFWLVWWAWTQFTWALNAADTTHPSVQFGTLVATCALWWSHFIGAKPRLDASLEEAGGIERTIIARNAYTLLHFPMVLGIIAFATGVEAAVHDPGHALGVGARLALGAGMLLFTGSMALALWRGTGQLPVARLLIGTVIALAIALWANAPPAALLALVALGAMAISWSERRGEAVSAL